MSWGLSAGYLINAAAAQEAAARQEMALHRERGQRSLDRLMGQHGAANDMTQWPEKTKKGAHDCVGCGAPLFGVINENCQYCKRPIK